MERAINTVSVITESDSRWFSGHFPDNPILPGIAQLKMIVDLITTSTTDAVRLAGLRRIKFRRIVRPGEQLDIQVLPDSTDNYYTFKITCGNEDVCSGKIHFTQNEKVRLHE